MIGDKIKELRKDKHILQKDLAKALNVSASTIAMWETNSRIPDIETLKKIALYFDVTSDFLLDIKKLSLESEREAYRALFSDMSDDELKEMKQFTSYLRWKRDQMRNATDK